MAHEPERPAGVPAPAEWQPDEQAFRLVAREGEGAADEALRMWRADGSPLFEGRLRAGTLEGPFKRFHPSGRLAREGRYQEGHHQGTVVAYASDEPGAEPLRGCCVPRGARRMEARYENGNLLREIFFDGEGFALLSSGERRPERPAGVPEEAGFDESTQRFYAGPYDPATHGACGTWSWWRLDGSLSEQADYEDGRRVAVRHHDSAGGLVESIALLAHEGFEDIRHGAWWRRLDGEPNVGTPIAVDAAAVGARQVHGQFDNGQAVGRWVFLDGAGRACAHRELGRPLGAIDRLGAELLAHDERERAWWCAKADALEAEGWVRESLLAEARAFAGDAQPFLTRLSRVALPTTAAQAGELAARATDGENRSLVQLLDALLCGGDAVALLRALATHVGGVGRAALDFVNLAIALAPDRHEAHLTRALLRIERGQHEGALEDAERLRGALPEAASFIGDYTRVLRPRFDFWPAAVSLPGLPEEIPVEPAQPFERVQHVLAVYATRLSRVRAAQLRFRPDAPGWIVPELAAFLLEGPVALERGEAVIADEDENGAIEETTVTIDETLEPDALAGCGVPALMSLARANWAALCWLLWAIGASEVARPQTAQPHPDYPRALAMALSRAWRARDALVTSGLRAMTQGVPGFTWEGLDIDEMPKLFAQLAAEEYLEVRAVLLWLSNPGNLSPFQNDLRQV